MFFVTVSKLVLFYHRDEKISIADSRVDMLSPNKSFFGCVAVLPMLDLLKVILKRMKRNEDDK